MKILPVNIRVFVLANPIMKFNVYAKQNILENTVKILVGFVIVYLKEKYSLNLFLAPSIPKCTRFCHNDGLCLVGEKQINKPGNLRKKNFSLSLSFYVQIDESNKEQCICKSNYTGSSCELSKENCNGK